MQAIARVNRVFKDKPGGLVVDYLGLADELKQALATYTESGGTGRDGARPGRGRRRDAGEVRGLLRRCFHGFDWSTVDDRHAAERLGLLPAAQEHILAQEDGKERCCGAVTRAVAGVRAGGAARRGAAHPRRRRLLPGGAAVLAKSAPRRRAAARRTSTTRSGRSSRGGGAGRGHRHLRRGRAREARHLDPLGRVPGRGARHAAAQPRRRAAAEAAQGRDQDARRNATSSRRARSPRCSSRRCASTRTAPSRRRR